MCAMNGVTGDFPHRQKTRKKRDEKKNVVLRVGGRRSVKAVGAPFLRSRRLEGVPREQ